MLHNQHKKGRAGIHISLVPPDKLSPFDRDKYIQTKGNSIYLDEKVNKYINELIGDKCIILDDVVRQQHIYDETMGRADIPHVVDPVSRVSRVDIYEDIFVLTNILAALWKFRSASDRCMHYGHGMGRYSLSCYVYIFSVNDLKKAGFVDVGIGRHQAMSHESTGRKQLPIKPRACYKVFFQWEGYPKCNCN